MRRRCGDIMMRRRCGDIMMRRRCGDIMIKRRCGDIMMRCRCGNIMMRRRFGDHDETHISLLACDFESQGHPSLNLTFSFIIWITVINISLCL